MKRFFKCKLFCGIIIILKFGMFTKIVILKYILVSMSANDLLIFLVMFVFLASMKSLNVC